MSPMGGMYRVNLTPLNRALWCSKMQFNTLENKTSCYNIVQLVNNPLCYLCEILMVGDKTMETFWSVILFIFS